MSASLKSGSHAAPVIKQNASKDGRVQLEINAGGARVQVIRINGQPSAQDDVIDGFPTAYVWVKGDVEIDVLAGGQTYTLSWPNPQPQPPSPTGGARRGTMPSDPNTDLFALMSGAPLPPAPAAVPGVTTAAASPPVAAATQVAAPQLSAAPAIDLAGLLAGLTAAPAPNPPVTASAAAAPPPAAPAQAAPSSPVAPQQPAPAPVAPAAPAVRTYSTADALNIMNGAKRDGFAEALTVLTGITVTPAEDIAQLRLRAASERSIYELGKAAATHAAAATSAMPPATQQAAPRAESAPTPPTKPLSNMGWFGG